MPMKKDLGGCKYVNAMSIGLILRARRESLGIKQQDVANKLQYKNANYISMIERGATTISISRIPDIIDVYQMPKPFAMAILKALYPDVFDTVFYVLDVAREMDPQTASNDIKKQVKDYMKEYGIKPMEKTFSGGFEVPRIN